MRNTSRRFGIIASIVAVASLLGACGENQREFNARYAKEQAITDCMATMNTDDRGVCERAVVAAQTNAPRYNAKAQCEAQFGYGNCETRQDSNGNDIYGPILTGILISNMLNNNNRDYSNPGYYRDYYRSNPDYRTTRPETRTSPSYSRSNDRSYSNDNYVAPAPKAPDVKRGGFGSDQQKASLDKARPVTTPSYSNSTSSASSYGGGWKSASKPATSASSYTSPSYSSSSTTKRGGFGSTAANDNAKSSYSSSSSSSRPSYSSGSSSSYSSPSKSSSSYSSSSSRPSSSSSSSSSSRPSYSSSSSSRSSYSSSSRSSSSRKY